MRTYTAVTMPRAIASSWHCGIGSLLSIVARSGRGKGSSNAASKNNKSGETKNPGERGNERKRERLSPFLSPSLKSFCYPRALLTSRESLERKK